MLAQDETDLLLFPTLHFVWAKRGEQAKVWLTGRNARRVLFGALNLRTGRLVLLARVQQRAPDFGAFLREVHRRYRGRPIVLVLHEDPSHTARASQRLAATLGITLLWLPKRSPELNPMDHLWQSVKQKVCANHQETNIDALVAVSVTCAASRSARSCGRLACSPGCFGSGVQCQNDSANLLSLQELIVARPTSRSPAGPLPRRPSAAARARAAPRGSWVQDTVEGDRERGTAPAWKIDKCRDGCGRERH